MVLLPIPRHSFSPHWEQRLGGHAVDPRESPHYAGLMRLAYEVDSREVTLAEAQDWPRRRRLWHNALAIVDPLL